MDDQKSFVPAGKYAGLDFTDYIPDELRPLVIKSFSTHLPAADLSLLQQIIDEVAAKKAAKAVQNVIGYLNGIARNAAKGEFVPSEGIRYRKRRNDALQYQQQRQQQEADYRKQFNEDNQSEMAAEKARENIKRKLNLSKYQQK